MSTFDRRDFLTGAAAFAAGMAAAQLGAGTVEAGDVSFMNNVPDPLLTAAELPRFKFPLESSPGGRESDAARRNRPASTNCRSPRG